MRPARRRSPVVRHTRHTVSIVATIPVPDPLPPAITRPRQHVEAVLAQSLIEAGQDGRVALAWAWALTGTRPSPIMLTPAPGRPPTREEIQAEADADDSTALPGVQAGYGDEDGYAWAILTWLIGVNDEIPLDDDQRGRFIGARDDYARTDSEIRHARDEAVRSLTEFDLPDPMEPADAARPWQWELAWMNAAWQRGVRDLLGWVLGDRPDAPLSHHVSVGLPTVYDLTYEEAAASDIAAQGRPVGPRVDPRQPPPQYGEAIQATIVWLRGETTLAPVDQHGNGPPKA